MISSTLIAVRKNINPPDKERVRQMSGSFFWRTAVKRRSSQERTGKREALLLRISHPCLTGMHRSEASA